MLLSPNDCRERLVADAVETERAVFDAILAALPPGGILIATPAADDAPISAEFPPRIRSFVEYRVRAAGSYAPRLIAMRLPVLVYGHGGSPSFRGCSRPPGGTG